MSDTRGPLIRTDIVDIYIFRRSPDGIELLQLFRAKDPLRATWHPVMGHIEHGETATHAAIRELREETGLDTSSPICRRLFALEQVHPFYIPDLDVIIMSPRFACEVAPNFDPVLNEEHSDFRWVHERTAHAAFMWPGQREAVAELLTSPHQ